MRLSSNLKAGLFAAVALFAAGPGMAEVDALVRQALQLQSEGRPADAYALLAPHMYERAGDPDFDLALGIAAADAGWPAEAIVALQRVLAAQPDNAQARAELARAYALAGDIDTARAQFDTVVQDPSLPDPVRQRFDRLVRDYDTQIAGGPSDVSGFLDVSAGYDSNINAATDDTSIVIPLFAGFGAGALAPGAREQGDEYYEAQAGISGVTALTRQMRAFGSVFGVFRDNFDSGAFDQASATGTAGLAYTTAARDVISGSLQAQNFWLGGDSYRQAYGAIGQFTHPLSGGRALSFSGEFFRLNYDNDPLRDADRYGLAASYATASMVLSAAGGHEETRRAGGDHLSFTYARANLGVERPVAEGLAIVAGIGGQFRTYDTDDPLFLTEREDEQLDASLGLKLRVRDNLYVRPRLTYTRNWSNIALYDYERVTGGIGLRLEF